MTSSFTLTLDTTAPQVVWGAVTGATAGELLDVRYASDEPLASATLRLADGRRLGMDITATDLTVPLPPDAPNGYGWITVTDDVGNTAPRQPVQIVGVIVVPPSERPSTPGGSLRRAPSAHPSRVVRVRSRVSPSSSSRTSRTVRRARTGAVVDDSSMIRAWVMRRSAAGVASSARSAVSHKTESVLRVPRSDAVIRRRDAPGEEEAMLLTGLL